MNKYSTPELRKMAEELHALHQSYGPITERVIQPTGTPAYYKLMNLVFKGTDLLDIAQYPKKTGKVPF